jgi:hypothetical protein
MIQPLQQQLVLIVAGPIFCCCSKIIWGPGNNVPQQETVDAVV